MPDTHDECVAVCTHCGKRRNAKPAKGGGVKLPMGWKREGDAPVCRECWKQRYLLRALTFPVAEPLSGPWKQLQEDLKQMWVQSTAASNWMMTELYIRDSRRDIGAEKMPAQPRTYLYPEARVLFPALAPQTVSALEQAMQRKYRARRYEVMWTHASSLPALRYPQPYPIHNQSWDYGFDEGDRPVITCRIGAATWKLRLKGGPRYRRQIGGLRRMAERGELSLLRAQDGTIMAKLVGWITRTEARADQGAALIVRTGKDHLLAALDIKAERLWVENYDQLPRWIAEHAKHLHRWAEDQKAEQRPVASFSARRQAAVIKQHHRINSAIQSAAAHLGNFALRRRFSRVIYDDRERWLNPFPYFQLEERIKTVLDERGIQFEKTAAGDGETSQPSPEE